ncbi:hypothetical protein GBA52_026833 [Prunus armeniaca]|nr:hypothetical protein GBA52_026833 [Prunus armeniaca]
MANKLLMGLTENNSTTFSPPATPASISSFTWCPTPQPTMLTSNSHWLGPTTRRPHSSLFATSMAYVAAASLKRNTTTLKEDFRYFKDLPGFWVC